MKIKSLKTQYHTFGFSYPYNPDIVEYCRGLKIALGGDTINFDTTHKAWVFSDPVIAAMIMQRYPDCTVDKATLGLLEAATTAMSKEAAKTQGLAEIKTATDSDIVIPGLKGTPYPFQKVGIEFLVKSGGRAILADAMGTGKTIQTIGAILCLHPKRTLVVCPATMKFVWSAEVKKWSGLSAVVIDSDTIISAIDQNTDVWIVNYDLLKRHFNKLIEVNFEMMVLDEVHYCKNILAQRSRIVKVLASKIKQIIMLTGTPMLNRPIELFNPLSILDPKIFNNYYSFANKYCGAHRTKFGIDVSGATNSEELKQKLDKYMLRRRKEDVLKDLPEKVRVDIPVELEGVGAKLYSKAYHNFAQFLRENKEKTDPEIKKALQAEKLVRLNFLRELSAHGKLDDAEELINNIIASGEKVVVFASFVKPLKELAERFGAVAVMITGETDNKDRFEIVKKFQEDESIKVFLGGYKSAGQGITLTAASSVVFLDFPWSPGDGWQAEDRIHRIGSKYSSVTIFQMMAKGTIDDMMKKMLAKKSEIIGGVVGEQNDMTSFQMMMEDFEKEVLNVV
jgi:SWI/SNF-related matrix-associated actin-dependent regulator 1 of chromatin subfamily A